MKTLVEISNRLVLSVDMTHERFMHERVDWSQRLIMINGARGVGKTTLLLQHIRRTFGVGAEALYVSLDQLWFSGHTLLDLADYHYKHGGTHLFIDEVHLYNGDWQRELKNIYDSYPGYHVVFTGSSMLRMDYSKADLSRRCVVYTLPGLSFREYLEFEGVAKFSAVTLADLTDRHSRVAMDIVSKIKVLQFFEKYMGQGYYPFYRSFEAVDYRRQVERVVEAVIGYDVPAVEKVEYETLCKMKRLLVILSENVPFTLNTSSLCSQVGISRGQLLKVFSMLERGAIMRQLYEASITPKTAAKPGKLLFDNVDIMKAIGAKSQVGTAREAFAASMLAVGHKLSLPVAGDLMVDESVIFEVGGKGKGFQQIAALPSSYVVADDIEIGFDRQIPLWMLGFLY